MRTRSLCSMLLLTAAVFSFAFNDAEAGFPAPPGIPHGLPGPSVNVHVDGYLPAPPGVNVQIDSGRPYYVERDRRVYIERERPERYYKEKHYKEKRHKERKHHKDNGNHYGEDNHEGHGHGNQYGEGKHEGHGHGNH